MRKTKKQRQLRVSKVKHPQEESQIFKVQRPIFGDKNLVLIYNKDRSIIGEIDCPKNILRAIGQSLRTYWQGIFNPVTGIVELTRQVGQQDW